MKKMIILRKTQKKMKTFAPPVFSRLCLSPNRKKASGNERHDKATQHIHASAADLLHTRIGNLDWCKCRHCKNEAREVDCLCCREVDAVLLASAKIPEHEGNLAIQLLWATVRLLVTRVSLIYLVD